MITACTATRKGRLFKSGTLSPSPWDLSLWGQNVWLYTGGTRTEDKAPQGCDLSAVLSAGMTLDGFDAEVVLTQNQTCQTLAYCGVKMVLTMGSTLVIVTLDIPVKRDRTLTPPRPNSSAFPATNKRA